MLFAIVTLSLATQGPAALPGRVPPPTPTAATAVLAQRPPLIDGRDDDAVWRDAPSITDFREFQPNEDKEPRFKTEAKVAYDAKNIYVFVRAFDQHPDSVLRMLARRDKYTPTDRVWVLIDSYHDRNSGFEFSVTPAGVKLDMAVYNDGNEDDAWDAVWDVATTIDSLGWTAEFRIPLSQIRYAPRDTNTFGFAIWRDLQRYGERVAWPAYHRTKNGFVSQFGDLVGLTGLGTPRRIEVAPYVVAKNAPSTTGVGRDQSLTAGADLKYGIGSNLTLDGTINPDFGQVEADPAVLNLSAFETFFQERRPFFVAGSGIFSSNVNCTIVNCSGEQLFYSRRIGRSPQLAGQYGDATSPQASRIIGAAKLTGRTSTGLTMGLMEAYTERVAGTQDRSIEPGTNYTALRAQQDLRGGQTTIGGMFTGVNRSLDQWTTPFLRKDAYAGIVDFRHRFWNKEFEVSGLIAASRVSGSTASMAATQTNSVHYFQRPGAAIALDTNRTSLSGDAEGISVGRLGGSLVHFQTSYERVSAGLELNDLGFLRRTDQQHWDTWASLQLQKPAAFYRRINWNFNWWQFWTTTGTPTDRGFNTNFHTQLKNYWYVDAGGTIGQLGSTYCTACSRGGPLVAQSSFISPWFGVNLDDRPAIVPYLYFNFYRGDEGRSTSNNVNGGFNARVASQFTASLSFDYTRNHDDSQWFGNNTDATGVTHYTFAHLDQQTASVGLRMDYTLTSTLSLQVYAQPFVSKGTYSDVRELDDARATTYTGRYKPYSDTSVSNNPGGFNFKQLNSNVVARWEYRPGSALFLVWTQGRSDFGSAEGTKTLSGDFRDLFRAQSNNTFLIKASYWLNQ
jgi:hypothetical protein